MLIVNTQPSARGSPPEKGHWGSATRESTTPLQEFLHEEGRRLLPAERTPDDGQAPTTRNHPYLSARDVLVLRGRQAERLH